ncbi:MAG: pilus assembly protein PilN [Desulfobacterales bacterium RIFOXYA12_FULL_46_15]|nr:MAG: pilus assembly protein PilN [Desulfobacula sp. GWF2_41_7]OGR27120.1 MAG: pilus assembly protein PilN [Desulfobacterales bacterium RIFOXYA12_FULL_46_15]
MIKINLLPFRIARKKENIRRQISIFFLLILLSLVFMFWYVQLLDKQIMLVKNQTEQVNQQISIYKEKADRVTQIKNNLKVLDEKLEIVFSLKKEKEKHFILFKSMPDLVIPERMWLESFKTDTAGLTIKGIAFDNPTIAEFMEKLEKSMLFSKVDLKTAKMKIFKDDVMLKSFELLCQTQKSQDVVKKEDLKQGKK